MVSAFTHSSQTSDMGMASERVEKMKHQAQFSIACLEYRQNVQSF